MTVFEFHAAPPRGHWLNDPNGLCFLDKRYRLFAQHSEKGPDFQAIGWCRFSSDDLLRWEWDGPVISPETGRYIYSGSLWPASSEIEAYFTCHNLPSEGARSALVQSQHRASSKDGGSTWSKMSPPIAPSGRNVRDPFLFNVGALGRRMLLAKPCDWTDWRDDFSSSVEVLEERNDAWVSAGRVHLTFARGVMTEMPVLIDFGRYWALIVSLVDRRGDWADCSVRYWLGKFDGTDFEPELDWPSSGIPLDLGPDFYAAIPNVSAGWPGRDCVIVAWASNWATARQIDWKGPAGGPISLPRILTLDPKHKRLRQKPLSAALPLATGTLALPRGDRFRVEIKDGSNSLMIETGVAREDLKVARKSISDTLAWTRHFPAILSNAPRRTLTIFADGPLIECFLEPDGLTITAAFSPRHGSLEVDIL